MPMRLNKEFLRGVKALVMEKMLRLREKFTGRTSSPSKEGEEKAAKKKGPIIVSWISVTRESLF